MMKNKKFIVSCQALENEPLYGGDTVTKLAKAALLGGADGIRTSQLNNVIDIKKNFPDVYLISIIKNSYPNSEVFITPTLCELKALLETNTDVIALDATLRKRPKETLSEMVSYFKKYKKEFQRLMADCSTIKDVKNAISLDFDIIGTTLRGYTKETENCSNIENNYQFLKDVSNLCKQNNKLFYVEGGINTPELARDVWKLEIDGLVIGSAITRPMFITKQFKEKLK
ncbi:N-acetylmannosamine-6-phosphate 2-epimerase [Mycoplasma buteonis]|uniref:N-acetylmannosamine-6-phosphate 2-epimerase n=1 Tax=Mycoplasma buteonis TaxID=171280 RepID=UPI000ADF7528|nr:N-acetylmannosamine-6-phosphate 2-epimerase [Mycoplasma buteonis]